MIAAIEAMIEECKKWRKAHAKRGNRIDAAACAIRQKALEDVLERIADPLA